MSLKRVIVGLALAASLIVATGIVFSTRTVDSPDNPDSLDDCASSFCGCWTETRLVYTTTVVDERDKPMTGIEIRCVGENDPIAISDDDGTASFTVETLYSPGCKYQRCTNLQFSDPNDKFNKFETTVFLTNQTKTVVPK